MDRGGRRNITKSLSYHFGNRNYFWAWELWTLFLRPRKRKSPGKRVTSPTRPRSKRYWREYFNMGTIFLGQHWSSSCTTYTTPHHPWPMMMVQLILESKAHTQNRWMAEQQPLNWWGGGLRLNVWLILFLPTRSYCFPELHYNAEQLWTLCVCKENGTTSCNRSSRESLC